MIYTSGSTGRPKGTVVSHRAIVNRLAWMQGAFGLAADDRVLHKTPVGFDVSVWELFWPLMVGARLAIARPEGHKDPAYLGGVIRDVLGHTDLVHRLRLGRALILPVGDPIAVCKLDGSVQETRVTKLFAFEGLRRVDITDAAAGDIALTSSSAELVSRRFSLVPLGRESDAFVVDTVDGGGAAL